MNKENEMGSKQVIADDNLEKISGGVIVHFSDGYYVCYDDGKYTPLDGPYTQWGAQRRARELGLSQETVETLTAPAKEK